MSILFDGYLTEEGNATPLIGPNALKINTLDALSLFDGYLTKGIQRPFFSCFKHLISATVRKCRNVQTKVGHEIPLTRQSYVYQPPRLLEAIAKEIRPLEKEIVSMLSEVL